METDRKSYLTVPNPNGSVVDSEPQEVCHVVGDDKGKEREKLHQFRGMSLGREQIMKMDLED